MTKEATTTVVVSEILDLSPKLSPITEWRKSDVEEGEVNQLRAWGEEADQDGGGVGGGEHDCVYSFTTDRIIYLLFLSVTRGAATDVTSDILDPYHNMVTTYCVEKARCGRCGG